MITIKKKQKLIWFSLHIFLCVCFMKKATIKETSSKAIAFLPLKKKNHTHKKLKSLLTSITTKPLVSNQILQTNSKIHLFKAHSKKVITTNDFSTMH